MHGVAIELQVNEQITVLKEKQVGIAQGLQKIVADGTRRAGRQGGWPHGQGLGGSGIGLHWFIGET